MSDTSQGEGWWQASDGKWYPPELYPKEWGDADASGGVSSGAGSVDTAPAGAQGASSFSSDPTTAIPSVDATAVQPAYEPPPAAPQAAPSYDAPSYGAPSGETPAYGGAPSGEAPSYGAPSYSPPETPSYSPPQAPSGWDASPPPAAPAYGQYSYEQPGAAPMGATATASAGAGPLMPAAIVALIGAALCIIGSFLPWASGSGGVSGDVAGFDSNGVGVLVCGIVIAAGVALLLTGQRNPLIAGAVALAGLVAVVLFVYSFLDLGSLSDDLGEAIPDASLDKAIGLWLAGAGGVVGLIGGVLGVLALNKK